MYKKEFKNILILLFKKIIPKKIGMSILSDLQEYARLSYSQEGEDMVLARIFEGMDKGFYIDIGAHHPQRFSNTMYFYKRGWRGINIDATPGSMAPFIIERPEDINLEFPVSEKDQVLTYYIFNESALNTFSVALADEYSKNGNYKILSRISLETRTLESILNENIPEQQQISFLSIDVEGFDFNVLNSNDWEKYRPLIVLIECLDFEVNTFIKSELYKFMCEKGYGFYCKTVNTVFFKLQK
jgi:FkbM family methyltransferase